MAARSDRLFGIHDIGVYIPSPRISLKTIIKQRVFDNPGLERHMDRAVRTTGQRMIRFPEPWEDTATMAAQAAFNLLKGNPDLDTSRIRHLVAGTESGIDHSKSVSAYVQGMLGRAGIALPKNLSSFQVQHACAGGTMAMLAAGGLLAAGGQETDTALVASSDIAHYETESTAEVTQGSGAAALLLGLAPRLLEIDLSTIGYWSVDADDFFRPLGSPVARVKGSYSMKLYGEGLEAAYHDHCRLAGQDPREHLRDTDLFALHTPFRNMPESAMQKLLQRLLGLDAEASRSFLLERGFYEGVDPIADIGNMYTASLWTVVAFLLNNRFKTFGEDIAGKKMLLASYGSGNTMIVMEARVAADAPRVIEGWRMEQAFESARDASFEEYEAWTAGMPLSADYDAIVDQAPLPGLSFLLAGIRRDGYREYRIAEELGDWIKEREASRDLHRSLAVQR